MSLMPQLPRVAGRHPGAEFTCSFTESRSKPAAPAPAPPASPTTVPCRWILCLWGHGMCFPFGDFSPVSELQGSPQPCGHRSRPPLSPPHFHTGLSRQVRGSQGQVMGSSVGPESGRPMNTSRTAAASTGRHFKARENAPELGADLSLEFLGFQTKSRPLSFVTLPDAHNKRSFEKVNF